MSGAQKLLTEAELKVMRKAIDWNWAENTLRERGLIAPEPEPEPLVEVELAAYLDKAVFQDDRNRIPYSNGFRKGFERGQFLAKPELTREQLSDAIVKVFGEGERGFAGVTPNNITALLDALTEGQSK